MDDLYAVLGVSKTATADEIKKAYRDAAFRYHPDRNGGDAAAEEKFKQVNAAYAVLGDAAKRKEYDLYGSTGQQRYSNQQYGQQQEYDPFWEMFGNGRTYNQGYGQQQSNRGQYTYTWTNQKRRDPTRSEAFSNLLGGVVTLFLGLFFFKFSLFLFFPIGPILSVWAIVSGASKALGSIKYIIKPGSKTGGGAE